VSGATSLVVFDLTGGGATEGSDHERTTPMGPCPSAFVLVRSVLASAVVTVSTSQVEDDLTGGTGTLVFFLP
jgi:hypothetical protein